MDKQRITVKNQLTDDEIAQIHDLIDSAAAHDGVRPVSEHTLLGMRPGEPLPSRVLLLPSDPSDGGHLAGYAHLDTAPEIPVAELAVHPKSRRRGHGRALVAALLEVADGPLRAWAHGELPAARALAAATGFTRIRALWRMHRSLTDPPLPEPNLPPVVTLRTYDPARDAQAWVELNRTAFADHPEQGRWTLADLRERERQPWFDPDGFFLAERDGRLVGFHWTKVHDAGVGPGHAAGDAGAAEPIGEVYVVGTAPPARGTGLGRALTLVGLHHLRDRGLTAAMLYVDESNTAAVGLYTSLGFTRRSTDAMYERR